MNFIKNIDKDKFNNFVKTNKKSHFLQSYEWGEFSKLEKKLIPHYVGLEENNELVATALLLEKKLPFSYSYFYIPRGMTIEYNNEELLTEFVEKIKNYVKNYKAIFIKIDPDLIITKYDKDDNPKEADYDKDKLLKIFKKLKFKHLGFTNRFETTQPRFTFRIDYTQNFDTIYNNFSKTTKQRIKKAKTLGVNVNIGTEKDIETFYNLMRLTEERKDFITHNLSYYKTLYNLFKKDDNVNLFIGKINIDYILNTYSNELNGINNDLNEIEKIENKSKNQNIKLNELNKRKEYLLEQITKYQKDKEEYGNEIILNGHFIIKFGNKAWVLYAGNHNILMDTYANYETYFNHIKYYYGKVSIYDQFGTVGKIKENDSLLGLHQFKKKFGGDYCEFIGEFDLILNKFMYLIFTKLVPIYRNIIKKIAKKKNFK